MYIKPLCHYSFENPGTIFDEEAMTALELAARAAKKVNEIVASQNKTVQTVEKTVESIPGEAANAVLEHIKSGAFDRQLAEYNKKQIAVSPELFGAVGDGSADDTGAVRMAFESGKVVELNGSYLIREKIAVQTGNLTVRGGTLILDDATGGEFALEFRGKNYLFEGVTFLHKDYLSAASQEARNGVQFINVENVTLRDCAFVAKNAKINGVLDFYSGWKNVTLDHCTFEVDAYYDYKLNAGGVWFRDFYGVGSENLIVVNCTFNHHSLDECVAVWSDAAGPQIKNVTFANCKVNASGMPHAFTFECDGLNLTACTCESDAVNTFCKFFYDEKTAKKILVSDCQFHYIGEYVGTYYTFRTINGGETVVVKNTRMVGAAFGANYTEFYGCDIATSANWGTCARVAFNGCTINNVQTQNQFLNGHASIIGCTVKNTGSFIQMFSEGATFTVQGCTLDVGASFIVGKSHEKAVIIGCHFEGAMPNLYSTVKNSDVVMNNHFAANPNFYNENPPMGRDTNIIG